MTYKVWYCGRCRKAIKCEPRGVVEKGCRCKVPVLPAFATVVHDLRAPA